MGYQTDKWVDEEIIGFLSVFSAGKKASIIFHYSELVIEVMHEKFLKFCNEGIFKLASILVYLFLFHKADRFQSPLQKLDEQGNAQFVVHWNSLVRKNTNEFTFIHYVDQFCTKFLAYLTMILNLELDLRLREFYILVNRQRQVTGTYIRITLDRSECMDVNSLHIDRLNLFP